MKLEVAVGFWLAGWQAGGISFVAVFLKMSSWKSSGT